MTNKPELNLEPYQRWYVESSQQVQREYIHQLVELYKECRDDNKQDPLIASAVMASAMAEREHELDRIRLMELLIIAVQIMADLRPDQSPEST